MKTLKNKHLHHKNLSLEKWFSLSLVEQMANIGSEVIRAINWKNKNHQEYAKLAFERALELFDFTFSDPKNRHRLKEITRARELFADFFVGNNIYNSSAESWQKYFYQFNYATRNST